MTARQTQHAAASNGLAFLVKALNSRKALRNERLRELVTIWQASGPNIAKLFGENPALYGELMAAWKPAPELTKTGAVRLHFGHAWNMPAPEEAEEAGERFAAMSLFAALLVNPEWEKLGGPCDRCGNFYIKKRDNQKRYCSARCGNLATAKQQFVNKRQGNLERAITAIADFRKQHPNAADWKTAVAGRTGLTIKFLTRNFIESGEVKQ